MPFLLNNTKFYAINLDRDKDSWIATKEQMLKQEIEIERFSAIDGKNCVIPEKCPISGINIAKQRKPGEYGCAMSHISVIQKLSMMVLIML